jgi:hypothetical protein
LEAICLFECITVEFNIFKEKQKLIEAQDNLLMTKVQRIESEKHKTLKDTEEYIKTYDVDETFINDFKEDERNTIRVAMENSYHSSLFKEMQTLNVGLVQQQEMVGKIDQLFNYMKDIFTKPKQAKSQLPTSNNNEATSAQEDSDMSFRRH